MNDRVNPNFYLYHERAAFDRPPPVAMSELYELHAFHAMGRGAFAAAEAHLALAITLARNPASPAKQRGILAASQQRWPDAWFRRAQSNLALNQPAAARSDFDHARLLAGADWSTRPDVARFLNRLNAPPGSK